MGGAERNARKKKQQQRAGKAVVAARGASSDRSKVVIGIVVVVVISGALAGLGGMIAASRVNSGQPNFGIGLELYAIAAAVIGGVIWSSKSGSDDSLANPPAVSGISAPIVRDAGAVVVGKDDAKVTIDLYEDFLCPACGSFKKAYGDQIKQEIESGNLRVRYHALPFLVRLSDPEG